MMAKRRKLRTVRVDPRSYFWIEGLMAVPSREGWPTAEQPPIEDVATRTVLEDGDTDHQDSGLAE